MKWLYDNLEYLFLALIIVALLWFTGINLNAFASRTYEEVLFDDSYVHRVEISLDPLDYQKILENPTEKIKYHANIKIDGELVSDVAISTRGNATLYGIAANEENEKYSYKINFGKWHTGRTYLGLDSLILNNFHSDPSYLRDRLAFKIMDEVGVDAPLNSYAEVFINETPLGVYLAVEDYGDSFLARTENPDASLIKPEPLSHDRYKIDKIRSLNYELREEYISDIFSENYDAGGAELIYIDDNPENYPAIFDNVIKNVSPEKKHKIISALESISPNSSTDYENYWNVEALARYAAAQAYIINNDSYTGIIPHNYVLEMTDRGIAMLPWDYGLAFGDYWNEGNYPTTEAHARSSFEKLVASVDESRRPLWTKLQSDSNFNARFYATFKNTLSTETFSFALQTFISENYDLIKTHVLEDPERFVDMADFESEVEYLKDFIRLRSESISESLNTLTTPSEPFLIRNDFEI